MSNEQGKGNTPYDNPGQGLKKGLHKNQPDAKKGQYKLNQTETRYQYTGLSSMVHKEYSEKGSPYAEYHMGAENQVVSRKMFGLHGLVNPGHEPSLNTTGGLLYYQYDGQSTVSEVTDRHGDVTEQYRYDAFGGILTGITAPYNTVGYTGHHYDNKSGLVDMKARWYDPTAGRFSTPDTYPGTLHEPFTQHRYAYVGNNPINMWDPTGHVPQWVRDQGFDVNWNVTSSTVSLDLWVITDYTPYDSGWQYTHTEKTLNYHYKYYKKTEYEEWEYIHFNFLWDRLVDKETGDEYLEENSSGSSTGTFSELSVYHYKQTIPASELAILNREMIKNHGDSPEDAKPSWTTSAINNKVIGNNALLSIYSEKSNIQTQMVQSQLNQFLTGSTPLEVDGKFGGLTERAIRGAQKELGIPQNGIFNTQTLYLLEMATMAQQTSVQTPTLLNSGHKEDNSNWQSDLWSREWGELVDSHSSWEKGLSFWTWGLSDPLFDTYNYPMDSKEYWNAFGEMQINAILTATGTKVMQGITNRLSSGITNGVRTVLGKGAPKTWGSTDNLINSANSAVKGNNTAVGRAFQKHTVREGTAFTGEVTGNAAKNTEQGMGYLNKIVNDPNATFTVRNTKAYGDALDVRLPDGMGARWSADGKTFIGFLERFTTK